MAANNDMESPSTQSQNGMGFGAPSCSQLFDCDCDEAHEMEDYRCENCGKNVKVCLGCCTIRSGCQCGHCEDGTTFEET